MSHVNFYLKRNTPLKKTAIVSRTHINKSVFKYGIGKSIYPELWDELSQRPIKTKSKIKPFRKKNPHIDTDLENIETRLQNVERDIKKEIESFEKNNDVINLDQLREYLDAKYKEVKKKVNAEPNVKETLNDYIQRYINEIEKGTRTYTTSKGEMRKYTHGTIKTYKGFQVQFNDFQKKKKRVLDFDDITLDLYDLMVRYFSNKGYSTNSIGKLAKTLKTIMRASHEEKLHNNTEYQRKKFKTLKVDVTDVYLTQKEVDTLYKFNFHKVPKDELDRKLIPEYELTRDVFLCGVWTAQRYSDYSRIKPEHIKERDGQMYFEMITRKTSQKVSVPMRPELIKILKKYSYELPRTYEQKINANIKEICRLAKINEMIEVEEIRKGLKVVKMIPKYKMVKTHTARRTAISLMYLANIPTIDIQKISGHRTEKNLLKYIKVTNEETSKRLSLNPYFKGKSLSKV